MKSAAGNPLCGERLRRAVDIAAPALTGALFNPKSVRTPVIIPYTAPYHKRIFYFWEKNAAGNGFGPRKTKALSFLCVLRYNIKEVFREG
ncbi:MAG: hypothetical protein DBY36_00370 [Clostridiales bacterium]|nr:MAG: hypothetical protein DBY36_00370 [Clostridiales bacterium]